MNFFLAGLDTRPKETAIIGRLLAGYSELELVVHFCLTAVLDDDTNTAVRVMFRTRGEEQRLEIADALMRHKMETADLIGPYSEAMADVHWCRRIRNQFAHCHYDSPDSGHLRFVKLEDAAKRLSGTPYAKFKPISVELLEQHEGYFGYVQWCWTYLNSEYRLRAGQTSTHTWTLPKKEPRPALHN